MKKQWYVIFLICFIAHSGVPNNEIVLPDWTGEYNGWGMPVEFNTDVFSIVAPATQIKGSFSICLGNFTPYILLQPGLEGLGFTSGPEGTVSRDSHLHRTITQPFRVSLTSHLIHFPIGQGQVVPLRLIYEYLLGGPIPEPETGGPFIEQIIKLFFNGDRTLQNLSYSSIRGYRVENSLAGDSIWLFFVPPSSVHPS